MLTLETLPHQVRTGDIDTVVVAFPDLQGRPVGKRVAGTFFLDEVAAHGIEVCDYLLACDVDMEPLPGYQLASWETGYGDLHAQIDPKTLRPLPWLPGSALVLCDLFTTSGEPVEVSPRRMLRRQIERAAELGLEVRCATELEFYLFTDSYAEASAKRWQGLVPHSDTIEDYQLLQTSRDEYVIGRIRRQMTEAGLPIEFSKGEAGFGQHEINITYGEALEVADRHLVFKTGVKEIAGQLERSASFMAKWSMATAGSSCHLHTSLWDAEHGTPLMAPEDGSGPQDAGFSKVGAQFVAGQLATAGELTWCFAPYVNSYRRFVPDSWAPTALVWGEDNRTCGLRGSRGRHRPSDREPDTRGRREPVHRPRRFHCRRPLGYRERARAAGGLCRQRVCRDRFASRPDHSGRGHRRPGIEQGGGRRLRAGGPRTSPQHGPTGMGQGQPGRHRLGPGPQLRTDLSAGGEASCGVLDADLEPLSAWWGYVRDGALGAAPYLTANATSRSPRTSCAESARGFFRGRAPVVPTGADRRSGCGLTAGR